MIANKVLNHPEREEIIKRLLNGESVKGVEDWLKKKHPKKPRLQISYATLQKFRKDFMNIEGEVLENIKENRKNQDSESENLEAKAILAASSSYQDKLNQIVSNELDGNRKILEMSALVSARMEYYFNIINTKEGAKIDKDKMFLDLITVQRGLVQDWKKFAEGFADQKVEHNVNINVITEQVTVLKNIVFEVLQELDPSLIPFFIERINSRLDLVQHGGQKYSQYQQIGVIDAEYINEK